MFELAFPFALLLLPLPFLIRLLPKTSKKITSALRVPFYAYLKENISRTNTNFYNNTITVPLIIWTLIVCALAGPRYVGEPAPVSREGYNIMMLLDISASMSWTDMSINGRATSRLNIVKHAAQKFVKERSFDKIGLILFGTRAYLQTPLTYDHINILARIKDATVGLAGNATSIGDALGLAVKKLKNTSKNGRIVILLTDGANTSGVINPLKAAEIAKDNIIKVYTIGLEALENQYGMGGLLIGGGNDLDESTLQQIADKTNGRYFRATDRKSLQEIYDTINALERPPDEEEILRPQHEYYPWLLGSALVLFLIWMVNLNGLVFKKEIVYE